MSEIQQNLRTTKINKASGSLQLMKYFCLNEKRNSMDKVEIFRIGYSKTVDSRYLDFGYLEQPLISKRKSGPCLNFTSGKKYCR